jgi:CysZ protein
MNFFSGINYNLRGLKLAFKTPGLLFWGLVRLVVVFVFTVGLAGLVLVYHNEILNLIWHRPESAWVVWLWYLVSWLVALLLVGISAVVSFLISQLLFSVIIMDVMSKITEKQVIGREKAAERMPGFQYFFHLLRQEIPRTIIPVLVAIGLMMLGWFTPLAPVVTVISSLAAAIFLAWDNTDLVPARRLESFGSRFQFLLKNLGFHLGFGMWFLIPGLNILFLSFAPVGATLFYIERIDGETLNPKTS